MRDLNGIDILSCFYDTISVHRITCVKLVTALMRGVPLIRWMVEEGSHLDSCMHGHVHINSHHAAL